MLSLGFEHASFCTVLWRCWRADTLRPTDAERR